MLGKIRTGVAFALLVGASFAVQSAGLGKLTVSSALGQVLAAEIDLVSLQPGELDSLCGARRVSRVLSRREDRVLVRLARAALFRREASQRPAVPQGHERRADQRAVRRHADRGDLAGRPPAARVSDPSGSARIRGGPGRRPRSPLVRRRPLPLRRSGSRSRRSGATEPMPAASGTPSAKTEDGFRSGTRRSRTRPATPTAPSRRARTLSKIAGQVKPADVSMEQMLAALYQREQGGVHRQQHEPPQGRTDPARSLCRRSGQDLDEGGQPGGAHPRCELEGVPRRPRGRRGLDARARRVGQCRDRTGRRRRRLPAARAAVGVQGCAQAIEDRRCEGRGWPARVAHAGSRERPAGRAHREGQGAQGSAVARRRPRETDPRHAAPRRPEGRGAHEAR